MPPIDLRVPFHDKDAKRLGARWNAERRTWFVPDGVATAAFTQWLPPPPNINIRSDAFFIAEAQRVCWKCERSTRVFAHVLPKGHEILEELSEGPTFSSDAEYEAWRDLPESICWVAQGTESVLMYITYLPEKVRARMRSLTDRYWMDFSNTTQCFYWMNHCQHCAMKQGDFELIDEFDAPLRPAHVESAAGVILRPFYEPFEAECASIAHEADIAEFMRVIAS